jgi:hypothetical protein
MDTNLIVWILIFAGAMLQTFRCLHDKIKFSFKPMSQDLLAFIAMIIGSSLFSAIFAMNKGWRSFAISFMITLSVFIVFVYFRKFFILIDERLLLHYGLLLVYIIFIWIDRSNGTNFFPAGFLHSLNLTIIIISGIMIVATLFITFSDKILSYGWKVFFYVWFLIMNLVFLSMQVTKLIFELNNPVQQLDYGLIFNSFILGGLSMVLLAYFISVYFMVPLPARHQSFHDKISDIKDEFTDMTKNFSNYQTKKLEGLMIILVQGGLLISNYLYNYASEFTIINISLLIALAWTMGRKTDDVQNVS